MVGWSVTGFEIPDDALRGFFHGLYFSNDAAESSVFIGGLPWNYQTALDFVLDWLLWTIGYLQIHVVRLLPFECHRC